MDQIIWIIIQEAMT